MNGPAAGSCGQLIEKGERVAGWIQAIVVYATSATYARKRPGAATYWIQIQAYNKIIDN